MPTTIKIKNSTTTTNVPTGLAQGELAVNITDKKLWVGDGTNSVQIAGTGAATAGGSNTQVQYNSSGALAGSSNLTFNGTTLTAAGLSGPLNGTVGATTPNTGSFTTLNASGDVNFTGTGAMQVPVGSTNDRPSGTAGDFRFNSTTTQFEGYNGTAWGSIGGGATGGGSDQIFVQNGQTVTTNYSIPSSYNAMSTGPISINSGITVTIPSGSNWVIL